jgi:hypothetical protein
VAESNSITEAFVTETSDDGNDCPVIDVVNIIHMGQIRKKRRHTIGKNWNLFGITCFFFYIFVLDLIAILYFILFPLVFSLSVDEDSRSCGISVLGVISVEEPDEPVDTAPVSGESTSPVVYFSEDPAVVSESGNGYSSVSNMSVTAFLYCLNSKSVVAKFSRSKAPAAKVNIWSRISSF